MGKKSGLCILLISALLWGGCPAGKGLDPTRDFPFAVNGRVNPILFDHLPQEWIPSAYFDRGLHYKGSRFRVVPLAEMVRKFRPEEKWDAVLLECHDDYQGLLSIDDILQYDLRLALEMELEPGTERPGWLHPMIVIVPDHSKAPRQERFMTANIKELRFVRLSDYYAPLDSVTLDSMHAERGALVFKDNCLFCHSLKGVGGHKGTDLLGTYDFSKGEDGPKFKKDFTAFHHSQNPDKQDMEQFVAGDDLRRLVVFLRAMQSGP